MRETTITSSPDVPYVFSVRVLSWSKRRPCDPPIHIKKIAIVDFQPFAEHACQVDISFDGDTWIRLHGRVTQNSVTGNLAISAIDAKGNQVALNVHSP